LVETQAVETNRQHETRIFLVHCWSRYAPTSTGLLDQRLLAM